MKVDLSSKTILSFTDFMRTVRKTLVASWGKDKVSFSSAYPRITDSKSIQTPIITYTVNTKRPAKMGRDTQEVKPRLRDTLVATDDLNDGIPDELKKDISVELWGQMFDYDVRFEIWCEDGDQADVLAEDFQKFMFQYTGYFKKSGVNEIIFRELVGSQDEKQWRTDLIKRSLSYQIRFDEVVGLSVPLMEEFFINTTVYRSTLHLGYKPEEQKTEQ